MKLLLDMNLPRDLAKRLTQEGHASRHAGDIGLSEAEDSDVLEVARCAGEIVLTHDLDYGDLLAFSGASGPSVVVFRMRDVTLHNIAGRFLKTLPSVENALLQGAIVVIGDEATRVRKLPVQLG